MSLHRRAILQCTSLSHARPFRAWFRRGAAPVFSTNTNTTTTTTRSSSPIAFQSFSYSQSQSTSNNSNTADVKNDARSSSLSSDAKVASPTTTTTSTTASSVPQQQQQQPKKKGLKEHIQEKGIPFLVYWTTVWAGTGLGTYFAIETIGGEATVDMLKSIHVDQYIDLAKINPTYFNIGLAFAINEIAEVVRFPIVVATFNPAMRMWRRFRGGEQQQQQSNDNNNSNSSSSSNNNKQ